MAERNDPGQAEGWRRLMAAVVRQAVFEARAGNVPAICWLQSDATLDSYVLIAGIDTRQVKAHAGRWQAQVIEKWARKFEAQARRSRQQEVRIS